LSKKLSCCRKFYYSGRREKILKFKIWINGVSSFAIFG
jgi:hypothetical protein